MWQSLLVLDSILRGEATRPSRLLGRSLDFPILPLFLLLVLLGVLYGFCMGWFAVLNRETPSYMQVAACMVKVPALFVCTLAVTLPSLYVFNALVGSRLPVAAVVRLLIASLAVTLSVLASFGPIVAFFSVTTTSYPFMVLLNVFFFALSGGLGLLFLLTTLHRLSLHAGPPPLTAVPPTGGAEPEGALDPIEGSALGKSVKTVFFCWVVLFGVVGAQMSWVLRPFIGAPDLPFAWFRGRESHFFEGVRAALEKLLS